MATSLSMNDDETPGVCVFSKQSVDSETADDMWDDSALIKAYDKAIKQAKNQHGDLNAPSKPKNKKKKKKSKGNKSSQSSVNGRKWKVGDHCQAIYSEDNEIYEAQIVRIVNNTTCVVLYVNYGNQEEQLFTDLVPSSHTAAEGRSTVRSSAASVNGSEISFSHSSMGDSQRNARMFNMTGHLNQAGMSMPSFIPPPPPCLPDMANCDDDEAFHSMLIAWYMSGYHTGYYQGLVQGKTSSAARPHM